MIQTLKCEKLSPPIKSRTSSVPACSPGVRGVHTRVCLYVCVHVLLWQSGGSGGGMNSSCRDLPGDIGATAGEWAWHHRNRGVSQCSDHMGTGAFHIFTAYPARSSRSPGVGRWGEITHCGTRTKAPNKSLPRGDIFVGCNQSLSEITFTDEGTKAKGPSNLHTLLSSSLACGDWEGLEGPHSVILQYQSESAGKCVTCKSTTALIYTLVCDHRRSGSLN